MKKSNIYTKTGDQGTSSLYTGERRSKTSEIFDALGNLDELNASLGLAALTITQYQDILLMVNTIQSRLFDVGSCVATPINSEDAEKVARMRFDISNITDVEGWIDILDSELPVLRNFILPSGGEASSRLHLARAICRRAERSLTYLLERNELDQNVFTYINRLSDLLFVMARTMANREGHAEIIYRKQEKTQ